MMSTGCTGSVCRRPELCKERSGECPFASLIKLAEQMCAESVTTLASVAIGLAVGRAQLVT